MLKWALASLLPGQPDPRLGPVRPRGAGSLLPPRVLELQCKSMEFRPRRDPSALPRCVQLRLVYLLWASLTSLWQILHCRSGDSSQIDRALC